MMTMQSVLRSVRLLAVVSTLVATRPVMAADTTLDALAPGFQAPPPSARPWVYWFWNNGNVTSNGITADLEAMRRAGIGGVLIMDVVERFAPPRGTAEFMNPEWQSLFEFSVQEAGRLGLEINMANGPGWCGSSGPWITPELSMQMLVSTNLTVTGPQTFSAVLPPPFTGGKQRHDGFDSSVKYDDYYRDIAVLAYPATDDGAPPHRAVQELTAKFDAATGKLDWTVPPGRWVIERIGHTTTGSSTRPPVAGGNGLECDKLSAEAMDWHFTNMMGRLITTAGPLTGKSLVATHIDSWEVGGQNWTPQFRAEFRKRRGYDPITWLPCITDTVRVRANNKTTTRNLQNLDGPAMAARFRWDFNQTIAELLADNYIGRIEQLSQAHGLRFTLEGYNLPFGDEYTYTARADEPMTEFWTRASYGQNETTRKAQEMASVAHVYGHAIVGAEAFTSGDHEMWKLTPADIKSLGDYEFSQGINRFVVHRFAHQPYLNRAPGATMGPWGLHYERTQTWWEMSTAWHTYLARCQYLLRQGQYVADLCYLRPEVPNQTYFTPNPPVPAGYRYDEISAEALLRRASVENGRLVVTGGMSYRVLVVPPVKAMTPALAAKLSELARAGATILLTGPRPETAPGLAEFPGCDAKVAALTADIWGQCDGQAVTEHALGDGSVVWGQKLPDLLAKLAINPDFIADAKLNWIHRHLADGELYFVANPNATAVATRCRFRVAGLVPELWNPETGVKLAQAVYDAAGTGVSLPLRLEPNGSTFVMFRHPAATADPVVSVTHGGEPVMATTPVLIQIQTATYGVPGDAARTRDVRAKLSAKVNDNAADISVAEMAEGDDPAYGVVKTLTVDYTINGQPQRYSGVDTDTIHFATAPDNGRAAEIRVAADGQLHLRARQAGHYELRTAGGRTLAADISAVPAPQVITGSWLLSFPPKWGAPAQVNLDSLASWSDSPVDGVKYFSGTATYHKQFNWTPESATTATGGETWLDLGEVQVMARVKLNGQDLGVLWKPPFRVDVTGGLRPGDNTLEISVANCWPNRMIGDAGLAETNRFTWSSWEPFTAKTPLLKSGLLGPVRLETLVDAIPAPR